MLQQIRNTPTRPGQLPQSANPQRCEILPELSARVHCMTVNTRSGVTAVRCSIMTNAPPLTTTAETGNLILLLVLKKVLLCPKLLLSLARNLSVCCAMLYSSATCCAVLRRAVLFMCCKFAKTDWRSLSQLFMYVNLHFTSRKVLGCHVQISSWLACLEPSRVVFQGSATLNPDVQSQT